MNHSELPRVNTTPRNRDNGVRLPRMTRAVTPGAHISASRSRPFLEHAVDEPANNCQGEPDASEYQADKAAGIPPGGDA